MWKLRSERLSAPVSEDPEVVGHGDGPRWRRTLRPMVVAGIAAVNTPAAIATQRLA